MLGGVPSWYDIQKSRIFFSPSCCHLPEAGLPKHVNVPEVEVMKPKECMNRKEPRFESGRMPT